MCWSLGRSSPVAVKKRKKKKKKERCRIVRSSLDQSVSSRAYLIEYAMPFEVKSTAAAEKRSQHRTGTAGEQPSPNKKTKSEH